MLFSSCSTQKMGFTTSNDDVYSNPKEDRIVEARIAAEKKKMQDAVDKRYNDSIAAAKKAQKEKDDANPYYKDRPFKYDDYYDYEYATRVKRFNNNINGLGYYDNYYTNSYWYNKNPYNYGVSVYNGYSWWGSSYNSYSYNPSVNFYNNYGWGCNNYGYNGYNPYMSAYSQGYNNGFNNGMWGNYYGYGNPYNNGYGIGNSFGYGYNPYGYSNSFASPYNYGYNNPYNAGWGYYNSQDLNSSYSYGPRTAHGGGNSHRTTNPGTDGHRDSYYDKYIQDVTSQQSHSVKFSELESSPRTQTINEPVRVNNAGVPIGTGGVKHQPYNNGDNPIRENTPIRNLDADPIPNHSVPTRNNNLPTREQIIEPARIDEQSNPVRNTEPVRQQIDLIPQFQNPGRPNNNIQSPNMPINNGGGNSPSGDGGGHRPR